MKLPIPPYKTRHLRVYPKRSHTTSFEIMEREVEQESEIEEDVEYNKPKIRFDCYRSIRPCPYVSCKYNLYLDIQLKTGAIKYNFPDIEPDQMEFSCVLDIADQGGNKLESVGVVMNLTRERVRQIEAKALKKLEILKEDL